MAEAAVKIQSTILVKSPLFEEKGKERITAPTVIIIKKPKASVCAGLSFFFFFLSRIGIQKILSVFDE